MLSPLSRNGKFVHLDCNDALTLSTDRSSSSFSSSSSSSSVANDRQLCALCLSPPSPPPSSPLITYYRYQHPGRWSLSSSSLCRRHLRVNVISARATCEGRPLGWLALTGAATEEVECPEFKLSLIFVSFCTKH